MTTTPTRRGSVGWLLLAAGLVPVLVWLGGLDPRQALLVAAAGAGVVAVARFRPSGVDVAWPPPAVVDPDRGARREVARLSWAVGTGADSQVGSTSVRRLRAVARRRLARTGVRLDDPADATRSVDRVGAGPWWVLTVELGTARVSPAAFREAVAAVEKLGQPAARDPSTRDSPARDSPARRADRRTAAPPTPGAR